MLTLNLLITLFNPHHHRDLVVELDALLCSRMPYLSPQIGPSTATLESTFGGVADSETKDVQVPATLKAKLLPENMVSTVKEDVIGSSAASSYPLAKLEVDKITDATAGRLVTSLLGHVLFLKNQVPL